VSEYQYYEFQVVDQPLTIEDQAALRQISSRVEPTRSRAIFIYNYRDFPRDEKQVLLQYFDAMLYMSNWGSRRLLFRFPRQVIHLEAMQPYCIDDCVEVTQVGNYAVLDIFLRDADGGGYWIEGEGWLDSLVRLREDILNQDYCALYLAWLKCVVNEYFLETVLEPPLPPGLRQLSPPLRDFIDLFEIDEFLVDAAAKPSASLASAREGRLRQAIPRLAAEERDDFLRRLSKGEANLSAKFNRRLHELIGEPQPQPQPKPSQRTLGQLFAAAEAERKREAQRQAAEVEAKRMQALLALARREPRAWRDVDNLIQQGKAQTYQEAVQLLLQLRELARYQQAEIVFESHINQICEQYSRRSSLMKCLRTAGLINNC